MANFEAALESECGSGLEVQTLQDIKENLLAQHDAQGSEDALQESNSGFLQKMTQEYMSAEADPNEKDEPLTQEDKQALTELQANLTQSLKADGEVRLLQAQETEESPLLTVSEYPSEKELLQSSQPSVEELQAMTEDQLSSFLDTQVSRENV